MAYHVYLVNTPVFPIPHTHMFTSLKLLQGFGQIGHKIYVVESLEKVEDSPDNIFIVSDHCVYYNAPESLDQHLRDLAARYPRSGFILWFFHKLAAEGRIPMRRWILTGECFRAEPGLASHKWCKTYQDSIPNYVPWRFSATHAIPEIQHALDQLDDLVAHPRALDACFMGTPYKREWTPQLQQSHTVAYRTNEGGFIPEEERVAIFQNSLVALGWHSPENIQNHVVVERVFEGMQYGCIVLTDSPAASAITGGICELVRSPEEASARIAFYRDHAEARKEKVRAGLQWLLEQGTYSHVARDFLDMFQKMA